MKIILSYILSISSASVFVLHSAQANNTSYTLQDSVESLANEQVNVNTKILELEDKLTNLQRTLAVINGNSDLSKISSIPAGTVVAYAGETIPIGWLLCDGRAISRNEYPKLFNAIKIAHGWGDNTSTFNLPDYRGLFLRGVTHTKGEADLSANSRTAMKVGGNAGNKVGTIQADSLRSHKHSSSGLNISGGSASINGTATPVTRSVSFNTNYDSGHNHGYHVTSEKTSYVTVTLPPGGFSITSAAETAKFRQEDQYKKRVPIDPQNVIANAGGHSHSGSINLPDYKFSTTASLSPSITGSTSSSGDNETRPKNAYVNYIIKI